ncbi:MAG: hypothetical protein V4812_04615 [Pseudomonadota bacterium]
MSLQAWLRAVDDEALLAWANRGLLRRGQKLLEQQVPTSWTLDEVMASAALDGHRQAIKGVGFEQLHCDCAAMGPCHHLVCLLLGLRQRLQAGEDVLEDPAAIEATAPWLILDAESRLAQLGRTALARGQRWQAQGLLAQVDIDDSKLMATLELAKPVRLMIPRTGGLAASLCSCRENPCAHRALVILQLAQAEHPGACTAAVEALSPGQGRALEELDRWIGELTMLGLNGGSSLFVARGEALSTELTQADLPQPGRLLKRLTRLLDDERRGMAGSTATQVRRQLAELLAHRRALARNPLPQPLGQLAGVHRRNYLLCQELPLIALAAECWETHSGYRGYSLHFLSPRDGRCYSLSESRALALNPQWKPHEALIQASFCGHRLTAMLGMRCVLEKGWVSEEGRLANREGTRLRIEGPLPHDELMALAESPRQRLRKIATQRSTWLYRSDPQPWGLVAGWVSELPVFERYTQRWLGEGSGPDDERFRILVPGTAAGAQAMKRLQRAEQEGEGAWLFGRWSVEDEWPTLSPIALCDKRGLRLLFCEAP